MSNASKRCSKCGQIKSLDEFYKCRRAGDGHQSACRECQKSTLYRTKYEPDMDSTKQCSRCGQIRPAALFSRQSRSKTGLASACKDCKAGYARRAYESETPEKKSHRVAMQKRWRRLNPDAQRAIGKRWRDANPEKRRAAHAAWAADNKEWRKEYERTRVRKPPDAAARRRSNREWRKRNKDAVREQTRSWRARNRQRAREQVQRRRAIKSAAPTFAMTKRDLNKLSGAACVACGSPADSVDHLIPLSRGGSHGAGNLAPMCRTCNSSKSAKTISEWRKANDWLPLGSFPQRKDRADGAA